MFRPLLNGILLLSVGISFSFSALAAPKDCEKLLRDAAVQGVEEGMYSSFHPVQIYGRVNAFRKTIENLSGSTHPFGVQLLNEVALSEFNTIFTSLEAVAERDKSLPIPTEGLAYKYIEVMLISLEVLPPTHPSYALIREAAAMKLEILKASLERPKHGLLN